MMFRGGRQFAEMGSELRRRGKSDQIGKRVGGNSILTC